MPELLILKNYVLNQHFITAYIQGPAVDSFYKTESDILVGFS